jgi:phosphonate transport system substrate-binding protein
MALPGIAAFVIGVLIFAANGERSETGNIDSASIIRIGVLPDRSPEVLRQRFEPVLEYLSEYLQTPCELVVPESYAHLLKLFHARKVDLAYFGGYSYVKAHQKDSAIPLVMRRVDTRFTSLFIVNANSPAQTLENLENKRIAFGSRLSTSGHLMPRYFLQQENINPESFFSEVQYSGAHDKTAYWVRDGLVDVGAANATTIRSMLDKKVIKSNDIRILWETPPYADYVWAIQPQFSTSFHARIRDAFLQLSPDNADHAIILKKLNAVGYIPADPDFFAPLASIADATESLLSTDK